MVLPRGVRECNGNRNGVRPTTMGPPGFQNRNDPPRGVCGLESQERHSLEQLHEMLFLSDRARLLLGRTRNSSDMEERRVPNEQQI
ncbi:unnamed protein product [Boreogadus saida]